MGKCWIRKALFSLNLGGGIVYTLRNTIGGEYTAVGLSSYMDESERKGNALSQTEHRLRRVG